RNLGRRQGREGRAWCSGPGRGPFSLNQEFARSVQALVRCSQSASRGLSFTLNAVKHVPKITTREWFPTLAETMAHAARVVGAGAEPARSPGPHLGNARLARL